MEVHGSKCVKFKINQSAIKWMKEWMNKKMNQFVLNKSIKEKQGT